MAPQRAVPNLSHAFAELEENAQRSAESARNARAKRATAVAQERADSAWLVGEFLAVIEGAGRRGLTSVPRMRVIEPSRWFAALSHSSVPHGKKAGAVEGWIIRPYSGGESGYEWDIPTKAGLLLDRDGRLHEFSDSIWRPPAPEIHLYEDESERVYHPGHDDLPVSAAELATFLASCLHQ